MQRIVLIRPSLDLQTNLKCFPQISKPLRKNILDCVINEFSESTVNNRIFVYTMIFIFKKGVILLQEYHVKELWKTNIILQWQSCNVP